MSLAVISAGFGRTGTMSLKLALEQLGFGPCHHMAEVIPNGETQVPLWNAALAGKPDFKAIYEGYMSAVDWPTAAFWQELADTLSRCKDHPVIALRRKLVQQHIRNDSRDRMGA